MAIVTSFRNKMPPDGGCRKADKLQTPSSSICIFSTSFLSALLVLFLLCRNWEPFVYGAVMSVTQVVQTGTCTHANDYKWVFWWHSTPYSRISLHSTLHLHMRKVMGAPSMGTASHSVSAIICCDYWVAQSHFPPSSGAVQTLSSEWRVKVETRSICEYQGQSSTNFNRGNNAWGPWTRFRCMLKKLRRSKLPDLHHCISQLYDGFGTANPKQYYYCNFG